MARPPPSPPSSAEAALRGAFVPATGSALEGARLVSGTGEDLGVVVGVQADRHGHPKWIAFMEDPASHETRRLAPLKFVKSFEHGVVQLKGPREGYHITRVRS
jgi:hypothetical protein